MRNEASWDRAARIAAGIVLLIVGFGVVGGTGGTIIGVIALVPLLTGLIGWCPLYSLLGMRTDKSRTDVGAH
jgi:hypothetical protein